MFRSCIEIRKFYENYIRQDNADDEKQNETVVPPCEYRTGAELPS